MQDLVVDRKGAPVLRHYLAGKLLRKLLENEIKSAVLHGEHNCVVEMKIGSDQKVIKGTQINTTGLQAISDSHAEAGLSAVDGAHIHVGPVMSMELQPKISSKN